MSTYVIDSSYIATWLLEDEADFETQKLLLDFQKREIDLLAPNFLQIEIGNVLKTNVLRGRIEQQKALETFKQFLQLPISYVDVDLEVCLQIAFKYDLTVYDATYLALALSAQTLLLTKDKRLALAYSNTAQGVSEPTVKYQTGRISKRRSTKQLQDYYNIQMAILLKKLQKETTQSPVDFR